MTTLEEIRATVQARYGATAQRVLEGATTPSSCCGPAEGSSGCCGSTNESWDPITADLYAAGETAGIPAEALLASLGCGNPTALADLREGEVVLDLGSGGGIDVLLSARRVGPSGKAYGLDMTDEMLALALENKARAGATNVEFLKGHIEAIPLPSNTVDVIISNCVINLSGDKGRVLAEAFRVLRPGGRFAVSDVIVREGLPEPVKASMAMWTGCVGGALEEQEFLALLTAVGFYFLRVPYWLTFSILTGAVAIIPFFGTLVSTALPALFMLGDRGLGAAMLVVGWGTVVHLFEGNVLMPKVMQGKVHLPPVMTILSVLIMGTMIGGVGLVVAVPALAVVMVVVRRILMNRIYEGKGFRRTVRDRTTTLRVPVPDGNVLLPSGPEPDVVSHLERKRGAAAPPVTV